MPKLTEIKALPGRSNYRNGCEKSEFSQDELEWPTWPILDTKALFGFAGEFVALATKNSEADPAAVLLTFLTRFGVECGPGPYLMIGDTKHPARVFSVIVGASSKARKGTSGKPVVRLFELESAILCHENMSLIQYSPARTSPGPLSSGEGIIYAVRDSREEWNSKEQKYIEVDPGVRDKRLFIYDEEFGSALSCTKREGNILSTIIRCAWDTGTLEPLTKTSRIKATGAHLGICTHITLEELSQKLSAEEAFNGFANRFLWCLARRSKIVPLPEPMPQEKLSPLQAELLEIMSQALSFEKMYLDGYTKEMWESVYPEVTKDRGGLVGSVTNRAEAQILRLSMIYALLDRRKYIAPKHLKAGLELWRYCEASAKFIFASKESNPHARKILHCLGSGPKSTTQIHDLFSRKLKKQAIEEALKGLIAKGRIDACREETGGKPRTMFRLVDNFLSEKRPKKDAF